MNYGLNWEKEQQEKSEKDWVFGATSPVCIAEITPEEREEVLPKGECQNIGEEKMDCASRSILNILETKFNWLIKKKKLSEEKEKFLLDNYTNEQGEIELSDRWIAIKSGTTKYGNSLKAPLEAVRKFGIVPKKMFPQCESFDEYYNVENITKEIENIAKKSLEYFSFNYEQVENNNIESMLNRDMVDVAGYAWSIPVNGEYISSGTANHAFMALKNPKTYIFDNYIDSIDGDFIKKLRNDYQFSDYGYRIIISEAEATPQQVKTFSKILELIAQILALMSRSLGEALLWDNPKNVRHSCRVIMDEYGLRWAEKDLLCACIQQESQFNPKAVNDKNKNGTSDYGLCQFNNGKNKNGQAYWIGKGADFKDVDEVLNNPEKNVRVMIREYKRGNLRWWSSYTTGAYKKYL